MNRIASKLKRGIRGGRGRNVQVKAAVTAEEKEAFEELAKSHYRRDAVTLSHLIREELIKLAIKHNLLPKDYGLD